MHEVIALIQTIQQDKFWGNLQIDFRDGEVSLIRKTETIKLNGMEKNRHNEASPSR